MAVLATREADVDRVKALLEQSRRNEKRAIALQKENADFISGREMDTFHFEVKSLEAQLKLSKASVIQARASTKNSQANLDYTEIISPVDGVVINRLINEGQTLASQFQTPELFIVAPDMEKKMHVHASVDEADIGMIIEAQKKELPVEFTVDAYPDDVFKGEIEQVRQNSTALENVVTYPVIVAAPNPDLKLLPGLTASLSFQVDQRTGVLRIPNAALRFYPVNEQQVHPDDRTILTGEDDDDMDSLRDSHLTDDERAKLEKIRNQRHVWINDGEFLRAKKVEVGLNDLKYTELVSGDLKAGDELVIDQE
jgi:HlyD family secretion protein